MSRRPLLACFLTFVVLASPAFGALPVTRAKDASAEAQQAGAERLKVALERFREIARKQPSLYVSRSGALVYKCARRTRAAARVVGTDNTVFTSPPFQPLAQTFQLHSRPGSDRVLYLDFDGHTLADTGWNEGLDPSIVVDPFDIDGNPASFSDAEKRVIQQVWRRVAEDYAPFDIDVTTEDPGIDALVSNGPGDPEVGVRALIGDDAAYIGEAPDSGILGLALLGTFGGDVDNPALVFSVAHGTDYGMIGDTVSHEVGHTLGLEHHGDADNEYYAGHGIWAPIMGSGPSSSVNQWSKGDYAGASNAAQDDLAVIGATLATVVADHPVDQASAAELGAGDVAQGTLIRADDQAWYLVRASAGRATFAGAVAAESPNLKLGLSLRDATGAVLSTSPADRVPLSASLTANLPAAGSYYLVVDGVGYLDANRGFTDYGSLGRFSVSGSWQLPVASTAGSSPLLGRGPLTVAFDASNSFVPGGTVASYEWSFSDGRTATGPTPTVVFATPGTYTATLTVTDNAGAVRSSDVVVTVTSSPSFNRPMSVVAASARWVATSRSAGVVRATFRVADSAGRPLPGVTVAATVAGLDSATLVGVTDRAGNVSFDTAELAATARGSATFAVRGATLAPYAYLPARNKVSTAVLRR